MYQTDELCDGPLLYGIKMTMCSSRFGASLGSYLR
jgi:hypothetical protein